MLVLVSYSIFIRMQSRVVEAARAIRQAEAVLVTAGAGIGVDSGSYLDHYYHSGSLFVVSLQGFPTSEAMKASGRPIRLWRGSGCRSLSAPIRHTLQTTHGLPGKNSPNMSAKYYLYNTTDSLLQGILWAPFEPLPRYLSTCRFPNSAKLV